MRDGGPKSGGRVKGCRRPLERSLLFGLVPLRQVLGSYVARPKVLLRTQGPSRSEPGPREEVGVPRGVGRGSGTRPV